MTLPKVILNQCYQCVIKIIPDLANYTANWDVNQSIKRSYSPWRELIPDDRTCTDALIPNIYCVCNGRKKLNTSDEIVTQASQLLMKTLNLFINVLLKELCQPLKLKNIISAEVSIFNYYNLIIYN